MLGSVTSSDPFVKFAFDTGLAAIGLTLLMMLLILIIRFFQIEKEKRAARFLERWRPLMTQSFNAIPNNLPRIKKSDAITFLTLWVHFHESLLGEVKDKLNELARRCGMNKVAIRMLKRRHVRHRFLAVVALGHLREKSVWASLVHIVVGDNAYLSMAAVRALVHIDPKAAIPLLTPLMSTRTDWSPNRIAAILKEAGADVVSRPLADAILRASPKRATRLIPYLDVINSDVAMKTITHIIETSKDDEVITACLEVLKDPRDVHLVRACLYNQNWRIRAQAAMALGRVGAVEDEQELIRLLADKEWWVRYAAAEALAGFPFVGSDRLKEIEAEQTETLAKEILRHVIAEREMS